MKLTIGNVVLDNNLILAPMAGVTDLPFRLLCKEQGAGLVRCSDGALQIFTLQLEGKKQMSASAFLNGHPIEIGEQLG